MTIRFLKQATILKASCSDGMIPSWSSGHPNTLLWGHLWSVHHFVEMFMEKCLQRQAGIECLPAPVSLLIILHYIVLSYGAPSVYALGPTNSLTRSLCSFLSLTSSPILLMFNWWPCQLRKTMPL